MVIRAGELRHLWTLKAQQQTRNEFDEPVIAWTNAATFRGTKEALDGSEVLLAGVALPQQSYRIRTRYRTDVTTAKRLSDGASDYDIKSVADPDGRRRELVILATVKG